MLRIKILVLILVFTLIIVNQTYSQKLEIKNLNTELLNQNIIDDSKSPVLAFIYSFLLPGMGELYLNRFDVGQYFTIADGTLWLTLFGFEYYGFNQRDIYKNLAKSNSAAKIGNKDENYFANLGNYNSISDYNNEKYLNREFDKVYDENTHYWNWVSIDKRKEYRNIWLSSEQAFTNTGFVIAGLVLNRLISGINAAIMATNINNNSQTSIKLNSNFEYNKNLNSNFLKINISTTF